MLISQAAHLRLILRTCNNYFSGYKQQVVMNQHYQLVFLNRGPLVLFGQAHRIVGSLTNGVCRCRLPSFFRLVIACVIYSSAKVSLIRPIWHCSHNWLHSPNMSVKLSQTRRNVFCSPLELVTLFVVLLLRPLLHCICVILCMNTRWVRFSVSTVHKLSSRDEESSWLSHDSNPGLLGGKQACYLCATQPTPGIGYFVQRLLN